MSDRLSNKCTHLILQYNHDSCVQEIKEIAYLDSEAKYFVGCKLKIPSRYSIGSCRMFCSDGKFSFHLVVL